MANLNGAAHIAEAVRSVLSQTERSLELIVSDDGSSDDSLARAEAAAAGDGRIVLLRSEASRTGPAAARNRALDVARGAWVAIVDNDDWIEADRLKRLIDSAEADGADIAVDDLTTFYDDSSRAEHPHLAQDEPVWLEPCVYAESNILMRGGDQLGYLKPVFRRTLPLRYDESLRIGEDADLVLRLLIGGAKMRLYPEGGYHYRKHSGSISHRLTPETIAAMLAANGRLDPGNDARLTRALARQREALLDAAAFGDLVESLKARKAGAAFRVAIERPGALLLLRYPIAARLRGKRAA